MSPEKPFAGAPAEQSEVIPAEQAERKETLEEQIARGEEMFAAYNSTHPEVVAKPEGKLDCEPEIKAFEEMTASFEATYSLERLHSIVDLPQEKEKDYPERIAAKEALKPIFQKLMFLEKRTDISKERLAEMDAKYKRISKAIGMVRNGVVDHTR